MGRFKIFMGRFGFGHGAFCAVPGGAASPLPDSPPHGQRGRCPSHLFTPHPLLPAHLYRVRLRGGVRVAAGVVGGLVRLRDDGDAGNAEGIHAHRLRLVARRQRRASAREAHNAAADRAEQYGANCRPKLAHQLFPVYFQFHDVFPFVW